VPTAQNFLNGFVKSSQVTLVVAGGVWTPGPSPRWPATPLQILFHCGNTAHGMAE